MKALTSLIPTLVLAALAVAGCSRGPVTLPALSSTSAAARSLQAPAASQTTVCPDCHGTGTLRGGPGNYPYTCPHCHGTGRVTTNQPPVSTDH